jgi:hypothetical protein
MSPYPTVVIVVAADQIPSQAVGSFSTDAQGRAAREERHNREEHGVADF